MSFHIQNFEFIMCNYVLFLRNIKKIIVENGRCYPNITNIFPGNSRGVLIFFKKESVYFIVLEIITMVK